MVTKGTEQSLRELLAPALADLGLMVEQLTVQQVGRRRLVRLTVDTDLVTAPPADDTTPIEPLNLDLVADATRVVGDVLDESEVMGEQPYVLEVGSPGVDRQFTEPRHYRRNVGRLLKATTGEGSVTGRIVAAGPATVTLEVTTKGTTTTQQLSYADVTRAQVQVEFARTTEEKN
ncbi:ribosome maturation factor RimP [Arsenicicoccus dermatophilus]|uniref:ribosome maturation factor RimP n=1 Tax=Arsenicicoccus dermatophilus TaxID=1076331 RepID=UPI001F4CCEA5|nr:ribosome maturation factor RimP [Arsenicicoccus dermatophilus]MCH8613341.1 ribosome maturation factor RimP [Arsenicicoccus dermatophilus]